MLSLVAGLFSTFFGNKYVVGALLLVSVFLGVYIYYLQTSNKIIRLQNNQLTETVSLQSNVIQQLKNDAKQKEESLKEISRVKEELQTKVNEIEKTLYRENNNKKSLEELATKKTSLVEKKVNDATDRVLRCFETLSRGGDC